MDGLTPAEVFVLEESDGGVTLPELVSAWTDHGDGDARRQAAPFLAEAVLSLVRRRLIDAHPASSGTLVGVVEDPANWLRDETEPGQITFVMTEAGAPWL